MYNYKWQTVLSEPTSTVPQIYSRSSRLPVARNMHRINELNSRIFGFIILVSASSIDLFGQRPRSTGIEVAETSGDGWFYVTVGIALTALCMGLYFWRKSRTSIEETQNSGRGRSTYYNNDNYESDVDAEKELEWLGKAKRSPANTPKISSQMKKADSSNQQKTSAEHSTPTTDSSIKVFQDRMKMLQYAQLPINSFNELAPTRHFEMLLDSDAKALSDAMDRANEEFEKDERAREAAIKTLAAFRSSNSVEALRQVALYDLSASLRSKAITVLTDFDHESVFETILLACADPTREVRAAAARGLFRLNFDRSGAWKRIIETDDEFRMSQAVGAATEAGIVVKSFERLVHEDIKIAYEAFTLVALMIKSGETNEIFTALRDHKDERVKYALLHVLKSVKDERSVGGLKDLLTDGNCSAEVLEKTQDVMMTIKGIAAHSHA